MAIFLDSNVIVYAYSEDEPQKQAIAYGLCSLPERWVSTQVMIEFSNIARKKVRKQWPEITLSLLEIQQNFAIITTTEILIVWAARLADRYQLGWFDSLIVTAALESGSSIIYSEDLNDSQVFEGQPKVVNPFKSLTA